MLRRGLINLSLMLLAAVMLTAIISCDGSGNAAPRAQTSTASVTLPTGNFTGTVALPAGVALDPASLTVTNSLDTASVSANGDFTINKFTDGPQLAFVAGPSGKPLFMGWLDATRTSLNAHSTAEVLIYMVTGCFALPKEARLAAMDLIAASSEATQVSAAIEASLIANPDGLSDSDAVKQALANAVSSIAAATGVSSKTATKTLASLLVDPIEEKSGLRVNLTGVNSFVLRNRYRRPGYAYIKQISYVPEAGGAAVPAEKALTEFEVSPVQGLNGLLGTIGDIAAGNLAYTEVDSDTINLPMAAGSKITTYQLMVVGPGMLNGDYSSLNAQQVEKQLNTTLLFIAKDFVLPLVVNTILPTLDDQTTAGLFKDLGTGTVGADLIVQMLSLPGLKEQAQAGDIKGAVKTAVFGLLNTVSFQQTFIGFVTKKIANLGERATVDLSMDFAKMIFNDIDVTNKILVGFDATAVAQNISLSNMADSWTIDVTKPIVRLTPQDSEINTFANVLLTCEVAEAAASDVVLTYHWSTSGQGGSLTDTSPANHTGTSFDSTAGTVYYFADKGVATTDSVTVEVFRLDGSQKTSIGTAQARVKVTTPKVTLTPSAVTITNDTKPTFTASVSGTDGPFTYTWSTARDGLRVSDEAWTRSIKTDSNKVQFGRANGNPGDRAVKVVVNKIVNGLEFKIGEATASISLETYSLTATPSSYYFAIPSEPGQYGYPTQWFFGFNYGVKFNKVTDATGYTVYLKNDFYYWGKDPVFTDGRYFRDLGDSILCWQYGGGGQGDPPVPTEAEMIAPYVGNYVGGTFYAIPNFSR